MKKLFILFLILFSLSSICNGKSTGVTPGQNPSGPNNPPPTQVLFKWTSLPNFHSNIVPPSSGAAQMTKHIDLPITHSLGLADITIPLYTIKQKNLEIPISLSYNSSGIKVDEDAGGNITMQKQVKDTKYRTRNQWQTMYKLGTSENTIDGVTTKIMTEYTYGKQLAGINSSENISIRKDALLCVSSSAANSICDFAYLDNTGKFFDSEVRIRKEYYIGRLTGFNDGGNNVFFYIPTASYDIVVALAARCKWGIATNYQTIQSLKLPGIINGSVALKKITGYKYPYDAGIYDFKPVDDIVSMSDIDSRVKGLRTNETVYSLDQSGTGPLQIRRTHYYDKRGRRVQTVENTPDGVSRYSYRYDFTGRVLSCIEEHNRPNVPAPDIKRTDFTYDHAGRIITREYFFNGLRFREATHNIRNR